MFGDVEVTTFPVSHDAVQPVGFSVRTGNRSIVIATDLGEPTGPVTEVIRDAKLVVLEANPNPSLAKEDDFAQAAAAVGTDYDALIQKILDAAAASG